MGAAGSEKISWPQWKTGNNGSHLTFEVSAIGIPARKTSFKMTFSKDSKQLPFALKKTKLGWSFIQPLGMRGMWTETYGRHEVTDIIVSRFLIDGKLEVLCEAQTWGSLLPTQVKP